MGHGIGVNPASRKPVAAELAAGDQLHFADAPLADEVRKVAVRAKDPLHPDRQDTAGAPRLLLNLARLSVADGDGLFQQDILTRAQGRDGDVVMREVRRRDHDHAHLLSFSNSR